MNGITYHPIGVIHSEFQRQEGTPVQSVFAGHAAGHLELEPAYEPALKDLEGFERIWVLYHFDRAVRYQPLVMPYLDDTQHGLFATRSPPRPNAIGLSTLRVLSIEGSRVNVEGMDILDGTPLLDIKPYVPEFDAFAPSRAGWFDRVTKTNHTADARFETGPNPGARHGQ
jgi:tRNA (adenine37-N6)-methyltransferase